MERQGQGVVNGEYTLRRWIEKFKNGDFNLTGNPYRDESISIDAGAYDWWNDKTAVKWVERLGKKICEIAESGKIDIDKCYVFYKQNCPSAGPLYDDFRICDIKSGDVLYTFAHIKKGCYGKEFSGWELWDFVNENGSKKTHNEVMRGKWTDVKKYFKAV